MVGLIIVCFLIERVIGTGGGHFESIDWQLKLEAAPMLS
jgi:hypothetical protein